ncbi:hypothetical protein SNE40_023499 [Patella caerulea]
MGVLGICFLAIMCFVSVNQAFPPTADMASLINLVKVAVATQPKAPRSGQTGSVDPSRTPRDPVRTKADPARTSKHTSTASRNPTDPAGSSTRNTGVDPTRTLTDPTRSSTKNTGVDTTRTTSDPSRSSRRNTGADPIRTPNDPTRSSRRNTGVDPIRTPSDPTRSSRRNTGVDPIRTPTDPTRSSRRNTGVDPIRTPTDPTRSSRRNTGVDPIRTPTDPTRSSRRNTGVDPIRTPTDPTRSSRRNTGVDPIRTPTDPTRSSRRNTGVDPIRTPTDPTRSSRRNTGVDPSRTQTDPTRSSRRNIHDPSRTRSDPNTRHIGRISSNQGSSYRSRVDQHRSSKDPQYTGTNQYDSTQPRRNQDVTELLAIATRDPSNQSNLETLINRVLPPRSSLPPLVRPSRQPSRPGSGGRLLCYAGGDSCFSYDRRATNGPACWYAIDEPRNRCCDEGGSFQSPINLPYFDQVEDMDSHLFYDMPHQEALSGRMENNGIYPKWQPEGRTAILRGVRKNSQYGYILDSISLHFGPSYGQRQSEHLFDGKSYDAEAHVVHYHQSFSSVAEASQYPDGVVIIAIPLSVYEGEQNEGFKEFIEKISSIKDFDNSGTVCLMESIRIKFYNILGVRETRGDQCYATDTGNKFPSYCNLHSRGSKKCGNSVEDVKVYPNIMLPKNPEFYNYTGSLTTPPCSESVYWMVAEHPALIKWDIVEALRTVESRMGNELVAKYGNLRPIQNIAGRVVKRIKYKSF